MSGWIVYSKDGSLERCKLRSLEYGGTAMGERAVTATFDYHSEVAFEVFDYIEYRGERFELEAVPTVKKLSSFEYQYELRFVSLKYELERCEMRDLVPSDNGVVYPTPLTFSFTGDVRYLTDRIQACLDAMYGAGVWKITIAEGTSSEEKNITIAQQNCWNALALVNSTYGLNFYIKGRTITIGGEQPLVSHTFEYGKGNGLYEIERASDTETGIVTKLRAYGSTRNLDYSYPKKPEWSDSVLPVSFALSPLRLMLPSFKTDGKTDYVLADDAAIAKYGIREASMVYDDIYPSIAGATYNGQAIDEIKSVDAVDESQKTFVVYFHDLGFDLEEHLTTSDAQISMKSGALQGYTFTISSIEKQTGGYKITLGKNSLENSEESGAYVPGVNWNMKAGDKFVLLNILMPQKYIRDAENRLLARANEYLAQYSKTNFSYNIGLHDKFLIQNPSVYDSLIEGSKLKVYDKEIGIDEEVTIQSITITEKLEDNILPQVKVTLNNEPSASTLDRIQGKLNEVAAETAANGFTTQSEIMAQYRKKLDKPFFDKLFVAIDANGNEIPSTDVITPIAYIKAKYHVASVGGFTMYAMGKDVDIPSLASGLPFDGRTIWYNPDTQQIEVIGGTGGGSGEGVSNFWDLSGIPSWITNSKPKYSYSEIEGTPDLSVYAQVDTLKAYVTLAGAQNINGEKNFTGGLKVNGSPIIYDSANKYWKLQGNLVLTGGITMYADDGTLNLPSIYDGLPIDGTTIYWDTDAAGNRVIKAVIGGGTAESVAWSNITGKPSWIGSSKPTYTYSEIQSTPDLSLYAKKTDIPSLSGYATESWVNKQNYATKATTLSGYGITDAYTKTNVDDLLKAYVTLGGTQTITGAKNFTGGLKVNGSPIYYDTEKKYWKLEGDLLVTGGVTMYGSDSSFTPSTIMDAIAVDGTTISKSGGVLKVIGGTGGGVADSVAWANITGKPTFATVATSGKYSDLSGTPSSLPASDVYSWAKASTKPSYSWSEITSKPTWIGSSKPSYSYSEITGAISTTELQNYLTSNSYLNVTSGDNRYLKLSGGTINNNSTFAPLIINTSYSELDRSSIVFRNKNDNKGQIGWDYTYGTFLYNYLSNTFFGVKDNGTPYINDYTIWHSGNDGVGSGLDADLLDGKQPSELNVGSADVLAKSYSENINYSTYHSALKLIVNTENDNYGFPNLYVSGLSVMAGYTGWQLMSNGGYIENPYFRSLQDTGTWKPWRQIAFLTDNVASATKLQTPRTIWGQSFDGSSNVDGDFTQTKGGSYGGPYGGQNFYIYNKVTSDVSERYGVLRWAFDDLAAFKRLDIISKDFDITNTIISFLHNGNVGVGLTSTSFKFDVNGTLNAITIYQNGKTLTDTYLSLSGGTIESSVFYGLNINSKDSSINRSAIVFSYGGVNKAQFGWDAYSGYGTFMYSYPSSSYLGIKDNGALVFSGYSYVKFSVDDSGNGLFYGGVTMYSQRSLKNVVDERGLSLSELSTIKPTRYTWKDGRDNRLHFGGIADDIQQVLPEVVYKTSEGSLTMDYGNAAFAVASSLIQPVVDHEKRIAMLQERIDELEEEIERLKAS